MRDAGNIKEVEMLDIDWMGFIFHPDSPRDVGSALSYIPSKVKRVGVFVNQNPQFVMKRVKDNRLNFVQLHGSEPPWYCITLKMEGLKVIKSFGIEADGSLPLLQLDAYEGKCDYFLFDTKTDRHGGSGRKFNWDKLTDYKGETPFILSGGIGLEDADEIKKINHPKFAGIDVNSRFELAPAVKDTKLLEQFISQLHETDKR